MDDWLHTQAERGLALAPADRPHLGRGFTLRLGDDPNDCWLMHAGGNILLNDTAAEILRRCDGHLSVARLVAEVQEIYVGASPDEIAQGVHAFLDLALGKGWIEISSEPS